MLQLKVLIRKALRAVNACRAGTISVQEVATLAHEVLDHTMEPAALVALRPPEVVLGLACAILAEVLCGAWDHVGKEFHFDTAEWLAAESDIEEDDWVWFGCHVRVYLTGLQGLAELVVKEQPFLESPWLSYVQVVSLLSFDFANPRLDVTKSM